MMELHVLSEVVVWRCILLRAHVELLYLKTRKGFLPFFFCFHGELLELNVYLDIQLGLMCRVSAMYTSSDSSVVCLSLKHVWFTAC
jgi:hypothetical protein